MPHVLCCDHGFLNTILGQSMTQIWLLKVSTLLQVVINPLFFDHPKPDPLTPCHPARLCQPGLFALCKHGGVITPAVVHSGTLWAARDQECKGTFTIKPCPSGQFRLGAVPLVQYCWLPGACARLPVNTLFCRASASSLLQVDAVSMIAITSLCCCLSWQAVAQSLLDWLNT